MAIVAPPAEIHSFTALTDDTWSVTVVGGRYKDDRAYYNPADNSYVRRNPKREKVFSSVIPPLPARESRP